MVAWLVAALCFLVTPIAWSTDNDIEFKGLKFGSSVKDLKHKYPSSQCQAAGLRKMRCEIHGRKANTFAGVHGYISLIYDEDRFVHAYVAFDNGHFDEVLESIALKYGKPTSQKITILQNAFGAKFNDPRVEWWLDEIIITAEKFRPDVNTASVSYASKEFLARELKNDEKKTRNAVSDM